MQIFCQIEFSNVIFAYICGAIEVHKSLYKAIVKAIITVVLNALVANDLQPYIKQFA